MYLVCYGVLYGKRRKTIKRTIEVPDDSIFSSASIVLTRVYDTVSDIFKRSVVVEKDSGCVLKTWVIIDEKFRDRRDRVRYVNLECRDVVGSRIW